MRPEKRVNARPDLPRLLDDFFDAANDAVIEHDFDAVRMIRRLCQDSLDDAFRQLSRSLILLFNDAHLHARLNLRSRWPIHYCDDYCDDESGYFDILITSA